jgi:hypothetical protein
MENRSIKSMILSNKMKVFDGLIEMFNKNPNKKAEKVVDRAIPYQ